MGGEHQIHYPEGHYELRKIEDRERVWKNLGVDATFALSEQKQETKRLVASIAAEEAGTQLVDTPGRVDIHKRASDFSDRQIARGKIRAAEIFRVAISEF